MKIKNKASGAILAFTVLASSPGFAELPKWSYDAGPDLNTRMGRELIDITANIPNMPEISKNIIGRKQKFRPAFGPIPWRMRQTPNSVKILFMGQDGTHIAEAAGRPATAGFGGRAQDLANYFGVNEGAAFINAYSFTIKGQYGVYNTPYFETKNGKTSVRNSNFIDNKLWVMSNNVNSPIAQWRNSLIDWIIRNNKESMKLVVLFGGAARDAIATYAISKGATVGTNVDSKMDRIQIAETKEEYAGGNNTFPSLVGQDGRDLYSALVGRKLNYSKSKDQKAALAALKEKLPEVLERAVFTKGGKFKNGMVNPAQLGGYNLDKMIVNGINTRSLKGLTLDDGTKIENDIIVISLPHPSSLSRTVMDASSYSEGKAAASKRVMAKVRKLDKYADRGWKIGADSGKVNFYAKGDNYVYGRSDIGPEFYDFGTPANRMVSKSTARRMSGNANVVIIGTRDNGQFDKAKIKRMTSAKAAYGINPNNLFISRPTTKEDRYTFDPGPGAEMAKLMIENLDEKAIFKAKAGKSFEKDGIDAYNVKTHPSVSDFGHYRGTFKNPEVLVVADPIGYDDIVTARALTGTRGQYLQGLMNDLGVEDNYLVIKTVPYGMDGATDSEYKVVLKQTETYREKVLNKIMSNSKPKFVLTDGKHANSEAVRILKNAGVKIINIDRKENAPEAGIKAAAAQIAKIRAYRGKKASGKIANIPRSHLSYYSRVWEGTSGDRVITSRGLKYKGIAFAEVVPEWAYRQELKLQDKSNRGVEKLIEILREEGLPLPYESIPRYLERTNIDPSLVFVKILKDWMALTA